MIAVMGACDHTGGNISAWLLGSVLVGGAYGATCGRSTLARRVRT